MPLPLLVVTSLLAVGAVGAAMAAARAPHLTGRTAIAGLGAALAVAVVGLAGADDPVGAAVATFVVAVGLVVVVFADRALAVHPAGPRFGPRAVALVAATVAMAGADHVLVLLAGWVAAGAATVALIAVDGRPAGRAAARRAGRSFLVGDALLVLATGVAWATVGGSGDLERLAAAVGDRGDGLVLLAGLGIAAAVVTRSAQLPAAGWLPASVAAPTVVSALLHAGVVNGSALLLLRFHPVLGASAVVTVALVAIGTAGIVGGIAAARTRPDVKSGLAWTTVAQMGFMVVQASLGLVGPALVHLMGHGLFKSSLFLGASSAFEHPGGARHPGGHASKRALGAGVAVGTFAWLVALVVVRPPALEHPAAVLPVVFGAATLIVGSVRWFERRADIDVASILRAGVGAVVVGVAATGVSTLVEHGIAAPEVAIRSGLVTVLAVMVPVVAVAAWAASWWAGRRDGAAADAAWFHTAVLADPVPALPDHSRR